MNTIYSLPTTIIQTNGSRTYRLKTKDYDAILQHVEVESKTNDTINLNFEDLYFESIAFKGGSDLGETTLKCIRETMDVKNYFLVDGRPITCDDSLKDEYLPELQFLISRGYNIEIPVPANPYPIALDGPDTITEPGRYEYRVLYEPADADPAYFRDWFAFSAWTVEYEPYTEFDIERDPANPTIFYVVIPDTISGNFNILVGAGWSEFDDVEKYTNVNIEQPPIHIQNITIAGPSSITEPGTYDFYASYSPSDANEYDIDWAFVSGFTEEHITLQTDPDDPFHAQIVVSQPDESFSAAFAIECEDNISRNYDRFDVAVDIYVEPPVPLDGNIYVNTSGKDWVLDKETSTWSVKQFSGMEQTSGLNIWTDGENIYYSYKYNGGDSTQYVLDKETSTWNVKEWNNISQISTLRGNEIWTDGENIYHSYGSKHYVLDKATDTWISKTWYGLTTFNGEDVWTDGENIYYSYVSTSSQPAQNYVLDKATDTWIPKTWHGWVPSGFHGYEVWNDGENIYLNDDKVLDKENDEWVDIKWTRPYSFDGHFIWNDGEHIYYSRQHNEQATIDIDTLTVSPKTWYGFDPSSYLDGWVAGRRVWTDNPHIKVRNTCYCSTFGAFK